MRFYTKEWYTLTQHQNDLQGFRKIPDGTYTDREIRIFYERDLKGELARQRKRCGAPAGADRHLLLGAKFFSLQMLAADPAYLSPVYPPSQNSTAIRTNEQLRERRLLFPVCRKMKRRSLLKKKLNCFKLFL